MLREPQHAAAAAAGGCGSGSGSSCRELSAAWEREKREESRRWRQLGSLQRAHTMLGLSTAAAAETAALAASAPSVMVARADISSATRCCCQLLVLVCADVTQPSTGDSFSCRSRNRRRQILPPKRDEIVHVPAGRGARDHHGAAASAASQTLRGCARATRAGTPAATLLRDVGPCGPPPRPAPRPSPPAYRQQQHHRRHCILGRKGGSAVRAERLRRDAWCAWDSRRWRPGRRRPCEQPVRCDPRTRPVCLPVSLSRGGLTIPTLCRPHCSLHWLASVAVALLRGCLQA